MRVSRSPSRLRLTIPTNPRSTCSGARIARCSCQKPSTMGPSSSSCSSVAAPRHRTRQVAPSNESPSRTHARAATAAHRWTCPPAQYTPCCGHPRPPGAIATDAGFAPPVVCASHSAHSNRTLASHRRSDTERLLCRRATMETGRQVFGRFEITGPLPDVGELERHAAVEVETGRAVAIRPTALAALRPQTRQRFRAVWTPPAGAPLPSARLAALAVGDLDGRPAAIRPRMHGAPGTAFRLDAGQARACGSSACLRCSTAGGDLTATTSSRYDGRPWLAPSKVPPKATLTSPPIMPPSPEESEVDRARRFWCSSVQAVTGVLPFEPTGNVAILRERQQTPTPAARAPGLLTISEHCSTPQASRCSVCAGRQRPRPSFLQRYRWWSVPSATAAAYPQHSAATQRPSRHPARGVCHRAEPANRHRRIATTTRRPPRPTERRLCAPRGAPVEILVEAATTLEQAQARMAALAPAGAPLAIRSTDPPPATLAPGRRGHRRSPAPSHGAPVRVCRGRPRSAAVGWSRRDGLASLA